MTTTIKLKHSLASGGHLMPQQAGAPLGYRNGCMTIEVTGLPDGATASDAKRVAEHAMMPSWLHSICAHQAGLNLYRIENLTAEQLAQAPSHYVDRFEKHKK